MSAWEVSNTEIDCLAYWIGHLSLSKRTRTDIGKELRAENYKSLRARYGYYGDRYRKAPSYNYTPPKAMDKYDPYDIDQAAKMVHFYSYQSCEHEGAWEKSQSYRWMKRLEDALATMGADSSREDLTWGAA